MTLIDHIGVGVTHGEASRAFYEGALKPLGYEVLMEFEEHLGLGAGRPDFWVSMLPSGTDVGKVHVAFVAESRALVDAFHAAALKAGGRDNGPPGVRSHYHEHYYGAFVLDPDGHNIEAVCHAPE